jgi:hypothetical protein
MSRYGAGRLRACARWLRSILATAVAQLSSWSAAMAYAGPTYLACRRPSQVWELTDEQLCSEWRASYVAMQGPVSLRQLARMVHKRQRYLDELERRNPGGLSAWLASGAWASSTPLPYLSENRPDAPAIDWEELIREQGW